MLSRPAALLLDFGGVLADAPPQRAAPPELVLRHLQPDPAARSRRARSSGR